MDLAEPSQLSFRNKVAALVNTDPNVDWGKIDSLRPSYKGIDYFRGLISGSVVLFSGPV
jgi:hypothetical protein